MEQIKENFLPEHIRIRLLDIPPMPDNLYSEIIYKIKIKSIIYKSLFAFAASVIICLFSFSLYFHFSNFAQNSNELPEYIYQLTSYYNDTNQKEDNLLYDENIFYLP
jgi:hypothetical protein